jgi:hypothetical protein
MKNKWLIIVLVIIVIFITTIIIININKEKHKNHFTFPESVEVNNFTDYNDVDTLVMIVLNKIFNYDTISIKIYYMNADLNTDDIQIYAFIQKNPFRPHAYFIFLNKNISAPIDKILSHELIHLKQMESGELVQETTNYSIYNRDTIYFSKVKYFDRPYEIEAFKNENAVLHKLNNLLYSK